jgi:hypothetical protein
LIGNCDEFIYYDDLVRVAEKPRPAPKPGKKPADKKDKKTEARDRLLEVLQSLEQDYDPVWGSMLKQAIRRVFPGFAESYYGFESFSDLLHYFADEGAIELEYDEDRRNYQIRRRKD